MSNELESLAAAAAAVDAEVAPQPVTELNPPLDTQAAEAVTAETEAAELASILQAVATLFVPVFPSLAKIYTPETCGALATATVPVMRKHGWKVPGIMAAWAEEIALATVALPLGFATWQAVQSDIAQAEKSAKLPAPGSPDEPVVYVPLSSNEPNFAKRE